MNNLKNNINVRRQRRNILKVNYYEGLKVFFGLRTTNNYQEDKQYIETHYTNKINKTNERIEGIHHTKAIKENKLNKFDEKSKLRIKRFKFKNKNYEDIDYLTEEFIASELEQRNILEEELNLKYDSLQYSDEEIENFKLKKEKLEQTKQSKLENLENRLLRKEKFNNSRFARIDKKIERIKTKQEKLEKLIIEFNELLIVKEAADLEKVEVNLATLESVENKNKLQIKKEEKLLWQQDRLKSKIAILEDDSTHLLVSGLKMYFGGVKAVNDLSFEVKRGEIFGLIGPNGAGKTTVFNCVTQFYKITDGHIYFRNKEENIVNLTKLKAHQVVNEGLTRSFQNIELVWELNVLDNLLVAGHSQILSGVFSHAIHSLKMKREEDILRVRAYGLLKTLGIEQYAYYYPMGLSYGVLKKIELARTLMTDPKLIILDEPAAGLNEVETIELAEIIKNINKEYGVTIFLVEHDMGLVMSISDRVLAINFGRKLALGKPDEIKNNEDVRKAYLGDDDE